MDKQKCKAVNMVGLKRIEGQIRGINRMVEGEEDCVKILNQIQAVIGALLRVEKNIVDKYLDVCIDNIRKNKNVNYQKEILKDMLSIVDKTRKLR